MITVKTTLILENGLRISAPMGIQKGMELFEAFMDRVTDSDKATVDNCAVASRPRPDVAPEPPHRIPMPISKPTEAIPEQAKAVWEPYAPSNKKSSIDVNEARRLYIEEDKTAGECAALLGVGLSTFTKFCTAEGITKRVTPRQATSIQVERQLHPDRMSKDAFRERVTVDLGLEESDDV